MERGTNEAGTEAQPRRARIAVVAGARPNFMKIAPLLRELDARACFETLLVHSGQHYDAAMSESFFEDLGIREPDVNLGVGSGSHGAQTAEVLAKMEELMVERRPDALLVVGDVNTTLAATLAAVKLQIPVAHVEAGLRSFDRGMPEEINRLMTDAVSTWLFTTEPAGDENLLDEGVDAARIHRVGNVMIDTLLSHLERARELDTLERLGLEPGGYAVLTLHRPSNVDDSGRLARLFGVLEEVHREVPVVFPVHPRTQAAIRDGLDGSEPDLKMVPPQGYLDFLRLLADARMVLTDSGGIQEETTVLGVPCLTLRENTERPITCDEGTNTLVGSEPDAVRGAVRKLLDGEVRRGRVPELWDGGAAKRIVDVLERDLGRLQ
ncbi:MAG: non-hydrolyzing UDP-N-acetylglucosamine 2-epimerase [Myxococcota bacterium]